jgi:hypothetical protein
MDATLSLVACRYFAHIAFEENLTLCSKLKFEFGVKILQVYKGKAVPLQAWSGPEGSRKLRFPYYMTTAQDGGKVVTLTHRPPLPPGNAPGTHFCSRLSRPQGHSAIERIMSMKNSINTIWNRTSDLPIFSTVP